MGHRTVEPADLFRLKFITNGQLSPDGTRVVYTVAHVSTDADDASKDKELSTLWLLELASGEPRALTDGMKSDSSAQWSPDGRQIAFVSDRGGKAQIYLLPVDGGEARRVTDLKQGVGGGLAWSPDGTQIAFTARAAAEPPDDATPYRVTRNVYRFNELGYVDKVRHALYTVTVASGETARLTHDETHCSRPLWSPDGRRLLYTATLLPDQFEPFGILRVITLTGEMHEPLSREWGVANVPAWLPDGRIMFLAHLAGQRNGTEHKLWVVGADGGTPECRNPSTSIGLGDGLISDMTTGGPGVDEPLATADGRWAYLTAARGGEVCVVRVALAGPEQVEIILDGERDIHLMSVGEQGILHSVNTLQSPPELYFATLDGGDERKLTNVNGDILAHFHQPRVERIVAHSTDGVEVEGWIMTPHDGQAPFPTILYIHGGPHAGYGHTFFFDYQMLAGAGYAVLFMNHRGSTGYGDDFGTGVLGDWGNLDYQDLMASVDEAIARGIADPDRLGVCGLSGGGNLSCWIIGHTDRFKAAVPENPLTNWVSFYGVSDIGVWFGNTELGGSPYELPDVYARCSPITYANRCKTPTLMIQGENDWRCPPEQSEQFYNVLKAHGCTVEMLRLPNSFHGASRSGPIASRRAQNEALLDWFRRYV